MLSRRMTRLTPYVPGEQPLDRRYIKLNTNENPYPPSPRVRELLSGIDSDGLRRYPDPQSLRLRERIAERYGLFPDQVFVGNGSDEVLSFSFFAFFDSQEGPLLFPEISYSFYPVYCDFYGITAEPVPLAPDFSVDIDAFLARPGACGLIFPNPNAPTGMGLPLTEIRRLLSGFPRDRVVILDEAYVDFGCESGVALLGTHPNLLVIRTFSKSFSLAGIRLGFALGHPDLVRALMAVKDSFNSYPVDQLAQEIGGIAVSDRDYYAGITRGIVRSREAVAGALRDRGWRVLPSSANFVFAGKPGVPGQTVYARLKEEGILVRYFDRPGIQEFVRITIGTDAEMEELVKTVDRIWGRP